ncbi:MAG: protein kinase [Myxococcales bacterium]|nr:protein kinase [Myxococcales bacterium]
MTADNDSDANAATLAMPASGTGEPSLPSDPGPSAPPPLVSGRYRILGLVGRGGMGSVYRARDTELDEDVALKMLSDELSGSPALIDRFRREVKLARRVTHENVARMFDIGEHEGARFLTMEFIEGESLADLLARSGRLPVPKVLELARAVCAGLAAAHRAGVVHRDLKPDNVMLGRDGRVLITDFGIARDPVASQGGATIGIVVGTPAYMAPEQVEARADIDARADIYALGAMLFELFTGEVPWKGGSAMAVAAARLYAPAPNARSVNPGVPPALAAVVERCMAREPGERYASADEVQNALAASSPTLAEGQSPSLPPPPTQAAPHEKAVAVLPFRNLGQKDDDYVADGLTEDLIDSLSMTPGLRVRPRSAVARYAGQSLDPRDVGRELGVEVVVEGSIRKAPNAVRLNARLISVEDGFQLWAQRFDRPANDLLVVSDETARAVAEALTVHGAGRQRVAPSDPVAVDLYLKARAELRRLWPEHVTKAAELFKEAHQRAPNDSSILAGYARACARLWYFGIGDTATVAKEARELAARALAAAPDDAEALLAGATVCLMDSDPRGTAELTARALRAAPENADALEMRGRLVLEAGRPRQALELFEHALSIEPGLVNARHDSIRAHALLGENERALELLDSARVSERAGSAAILRLRLAFWSPKIMATVEALELAGELDSPGQIAQMMRAIYRGGKDSPELAGFREFVETTDRNPRFATLMHQLMAELLGYYDDVEAALHHVERAVQMGLFDLSWMDFCPALAAARTEPRFTTARAVVAERARTVQDALGL